MTTALAAESRSSVAELKGSSYTLTSLKLHSTEAGEISHFIAEQIEKAPAFLNGAPIVIDCSLLQEQSRLPEIAAAIREHGLVVVGVQGLDKENSELACAAGLAQLRVNATNRARSPKPASAPVSHLPTRVISKPVRSGQQIYAKDSDLVVLAAVNRDAEVIADGHIHIWGALRGKALAGASGDESANIFARRLDAQLVSIAGNYRVLDDLSDELKGQDVKVSLQDQSILIERI